MNTFSILTKEELEGLTLNDVGHYWTELDFFVARHSEMIEAIYKSKYEEAIAQEMG